MTTFYCLIRKKDGYVFYVGASIKPEQRFKQHCSSKNDVGHYIRELQGEVELIPIHSRVVEKWFDTMVEWYLISFFHDWGFCLLNKKCYFSKPPRELDYYKSFHYEIGTNAFHLVEKYFLNNIW